MLLCQLLVVVLAAVKRFDAVVLHAWSSAREMVAVAARVWVGRRSGLAD